MAAGGLGHRPLAHKYYHVKYFWTIVCGGMILCAIALIWSNSLRRGNAREAGSWPCADGAVTQGSFPVTNGPLQPRWPA